MESESKICKIFHSKQFPMVKLSVIISIFISKLQENLRKEQSNTDLNNNVYYLNST